MQPPKTKKSFFSSKTWKVFVYLYCGAILAHSAVDHFQKKQQQAQQLAITSQKKQQLAEVKADTASLSRDIRKTHKEMTQLEAAGKLTKAERKRFRQVVQQYEVRSARLKAKIQQIDSECDC